ncbi:hypothetical protein HHI36_000642 [Cryptolaemus montrouzieri]|uniref:Uncharacterized protein n=1 Tax=Cryptolaemus montrouzieri TaxID=559131 RepID=A0ABD2P535_9CUCU
MARKRKVNGKMVESHKVSPITEKDPKFGKKVVVRLEKLVIPKHDKTSKMTPRLLLKRLSDVNIKSIKTKPIDNRLPDADSKLKSTPLFAKTNYNEVSAFHFGNAISRGGSPSADELTHIDKKDLRIRKKIDYKERSSIGTPDLSKTAEGARLPIYKQVPGKEVSPKRRKRDQYEFIPESDDDKESDISFRLEIPKKRKIISKVYTQKPIDRMGRKRIIERKFDGIVGAGKYSSKINNVLDNIRQRISNKNRVDKVESQSKIHMNKQEDCIKNMNLLRNDSSNNESAKIFNSTQVYDAINKEFFDESNIHFNKKNASVNKILTHDLVHGVDISIPKNNSNNFGSALSRRCSSSSNYSHYDSDLIGFDGDTPQYPSFENSETDSDAALQLFGFSEDLEEEVPVKVIKPRKINIIRNIVLTPKVSKIQTSKRPWRFNSEYITRNPHFIELKKNSLPSLNQDPVLDHTFDDNIEEVNKTILVPESKKSPRQQSILNYIETDKDISRRIPQRQSLYDIEELSPIKLNTTDKKIKDNSTRITGKINTARRKILGEISGNIRTNETSTPAKNKPQPPMLLELSLIEKDNEKENINRSENFGFDTCSEIIEEEDIGKEKVEAAIPSRFEVNTEKVYKRKKLADHLTEPVRDSLVKRLVADDPEFEKFVDEDDLQREDVRLFEDIEEPQDMNRSYKPRKKNGPGQNKKKEVKLSKEAKKWIKEFNEMCNDIDQVELEIE